MGIRGKFFQNHQGAEPMKLFAWRVAAILSLLLTIRWAFKGDAALYVVFIALTVAFTSQAVRVKQRGKAI